MIQVEECLHVTILVRDLERTRKFYQELLGLREIERPNLRVQGCWLALGEQQLHVVVQEDLGPDPAFADDRHFALGVRDYDRVPEMLKRWGVPFHSGRNTSIPQIFFRDPDGNLIELQPARQS